jgi:hypothetical protein
MGVKLVSVHEVVAKPRTFNDELKYYIIIIIIIIIIFHIIWNIYNNIIVFFWVHWIENPLTNKQTNKLNKWLPHVP